MERESFQNEEIARMINTLFVPVLVDRDERPDVDATYIAFVAAMNNGSAGWPANLVITPELSPIAGSSYLAPEALKNALATIAEKWRSDRASLLANGGEILAAARANAQESSPLASVSPDVDRALYQRLRAWFDRDKTGFAKRVGVQHLPRAGHGGDSIPKSLI